MFWAIVVGIAGLLAGVGVGAQICVNNAIMKYELKEVTNVIRYPYPYCSEFVGRTCCGPSNIDSVKERILRIFATKHPLSAGCREQLVKLECSVCDGDFGTGEATEVCPSFSHKIGEACSGDFFYFEHGGFLRPCSDDSIACSQLSTIVETSPNKVAEMFGFKVANENQAFGESKCFRGESSVARKGNSLNVAEYKTRAPQTPKGSKLGISDMATGLFTSVGLFMAGSYILFRCLRKGEDDQHEE